MNNMKLNELTDKYLAKLLDRISDLTHTNAFSNITPFKDLIHDCVREAMTCEMNPYEYEVAIIERTTMNTKTNKFDGYGCIVGGFCTKEDATKYIKNCLSDCGVCQILYKGEPIDIE